MMRGTGLKVETAPVRLSKFVLSSLKDSEHIIKAKFVFFFSLMKRSKNHTRSVFYEKTEHAHSAIYEKTAKNLPFKLKSFKWEAERFSRLERERISGFI